MKLTFLVLALATVCALNTPKTAIAEDTTVPAPTTRPTGHGHVFGGPEVPFPLSAQVDFPWATIEGTWQAKGKNDGGAEFSFHIQSNGLNGGRILKVALVGTDGRTVLATGTGYSNGDDDRTVRAIMISQVNSQSYWLIIRAFKNDKTGKIETVVSIRSFDGQDDTVNHIVVRKLSSQAVDLADSCSN